MNFTNKLQILITTILLQFCFQILATKVCKTFFNYFNPLGKSKRYCWENPDGDKTSQFNTIVSRWKNRMVNTYRVVTEDGYYLTVFNIPSSKNGSQPVFIQHSFVNPVALINRKDKSLVYTFVSKDYDVWVGNFRGVSKYSQEHKIYDRTQKEFWSFCFQELGVYDLPVMLNLIKQKTGRSDIIYVGFGLGSTAAFVYGTEKAEEAANSIKAMVHISPMAYQENVGVFPKTVAQTFPIIQFVFNHFFHGRIPYYLTRRNRHICRINIATARICDAIYQLPFGLDIKQQDPETLPIITRQNWGNRPVAVIGHYMQNTKSGKFRKYDYGKDQNMKMYNSETPPSYDLSKINLKQLFFVARNDKLGDLKDAQKTYSMIPSNMKDTFYVIDYNNFGLIDFIESKDVNKLFLKPLMEAISRL